MRDLVPGGFLFTHGAFWPIVGLVAIGTNAVPIILVVGLAFLAFESLFKQQ